jgi:alpha-L-rhamnosidase
VLGQYRTCWGWSLEDGRTTWLEVFDTRWSHCHQWAGCPTWQLSRYLLGLQPRFDLGLMNFDVSLATGSLTNVSGTLPIAGRDDVIKISWTKDAAGLHYILETPAPLVLHLDAGIAGGQPRSVQVDRAFTETWPLAACS